MLRIKKIMLLIIPILLLCGCKKQNVDYEIWCEPTYKIEYIRIYHLYGEGLSVRLDNNGNVIHCEIED